MLVGKIDSLLESVRVNSYLAKIVFVSSALALVSIVGFGLATAQPNIRQSGGNGYGNNTTITITNNTSVTSTTTQTSTTGDATVSGNTNGGNATSGNASNSSSTSITIITTNF